MITRQMAIKASDVVPGILSMASMAVEPVLAHLFSQALVGVEPVQADRCSNRLSYLFDLVGCLITNTVRVLMLPVVDPSLPRGVDVNPPRGGGRIVGC